MESFPAPADLAFKEDPVNVTISLSRSSVAFFKHEARRHHAPYQKMIRRLLDLYVAQHQYRRLPRTVPREQKTRNVVGAACYLQG